MIRARAALRLRERGRRVAGLAAALLVWLAAEGQGRAESARRVVLVVPEAPGVVATQALARVRGELQAARFEVETQVVPNNVDRRATIERALRDADARAAFGIFFGSGVAEIWVSDSLYGRTVVQTLPLGAAAPERRAAVLAVKAVDLLKATLAEVWIQAPPTPAEPASPPPPNPASRESRLSPEPIPPPPAVPAPPPAPRKGPAAEPAEVVRRSDNSPEVPAAPRRSEVEVSAGGAWLGTPGAGIGWAPMLTLGWFRGWFGGRLAASAFGTTTPFGDANIGGSARAGNAVGIAEFVARRAWGGAFSVNAAAGAGAYRLSVEGIAKKPGYTASTAVGYSAVAGGGVGAAVAVGPVFIALDARLLATVVSKTVVVDQREVGHAGRPLSWLGASLGARW